MAEKQVAKDEIIFTEGDVASVAYIVVSGKITLIELKSGREEQLRVVEPGMVFGDLALFDEKALRQITARALEPSVLTVVTPEEFRALLAQCPKAILPFMDLAFEKMKTTKVKTKTVTTAVLENNVSKIIIAPASEKLKTQFKPMEIPLNRLPFRIGGYPEGGEISRRDQLHLYIPAQTNPLRVSRQHCEIGIENKGLYVTDLGSRFCTAVNGTIIGRGRGVYIAPLQKGANEIILGAADGPYKLSVQCE